MQERLIQLNKTIDDALAALNETRQVVAGILGKDIKTENKETKTREVTIGKNGISASFMVKADIEPRFDNVHEPSISR